MFWDTVKTNINTVNEAQKWWSLISNDKININVGEINRDFLKIAQEIIRLNFQQLRDFHDFDLKMM